jgi:hypothetical protein
VKVYLREDLHAKVYLFGRAAVVCSANLSKTSRSHLDEAGILTRDPQVIKSIRDWLEDRINEPVTPEWLSHCAKIYKPPRNSASRTHNRKKKHSQEHIGQRVWLTGVDLGDFPDEELKAYEKGAATARQRLSKPTVYYVDTIRSVGKDRIAETGRAGDVLIQVSNEGGNDFKVYPHGRLLGKKQITTRRGAVVTYLYVELPKDHRTITWRKFQEACKEFGLRLGKDIGTREIRDRVIANEVLALVSPERLRKKRKT